MTLKNCLSKSGGEDGISLANLTLKVIKRHIWLLVLAAIGFLLNMPVAVALVWSNISGNDYIYSHLDGYAQDMCYVFNVGSAMIISVGAVLAAFTLFRYLHNRRQVDFYHSLPIRREKLYAANLLAGLLIFLLPYVTAHLLALPLLAGSGMLTYIDMASYLSVIAVNILAYMVMFALASMAMLLSGNMGGALKILFSTYALCPIVSAMLLMMGNTFLTDYANMGSAEMLLVRLSVIERYMVMMCNDSVVSVLWQDIVLGCVILAGAVVAGLFLYKKRDSECAGATLAFNWQKPIFKYPYVLLAGVLGAMTLYAVGDRSLIWLAFGLLFFTVFAAQAFEIAIARDFRAFKKNLRGTVVSLVLVSMIVGAYGLDVFGYEKWQPEADNVEAIFINAGSLDGVSFVNYRLRDDYRGDYDDYYSINPSHYYYGGSELTISDPDNVATMIEILTSEPMGYGKFHSNGDDVYDDYYGYYDYNDTCYSNVCFKMKNGGYKIRNMRYGGVTANFEAYSKLYDSAELRNVMAGSYDFPEDLTIMPDTLEDYTAIYGYDFGTTREQDTAKVRELWNTYRSEFAKLSAEELIKTVPLGRQNFQIYENYEKQFDDDGDYYDKYTDYWYHSVPIYPQMTETIKMLRGFYGNEIFGKQNEKYTLTKIVEYTPINSELQAHPNNERPDYFVSEPEVDYNSYSGSYESADIEVRSYSVSGVEYTVQSEAVMIEGDTYVERTLDLSRGAEIIANTVTENQLGSADYYDPWRRTDCLKYYVLTYAVGDGVTVTQTRYMLPNDRN